MSRVVGIDVRFIATVGVRGFGENSCIIFRARFLPSFRRFLSNILTSLVASTYTRGGLQALWRSMIYWFLIISLHKSDAHRHPHRIGNGNYQLTIAQTKCQLSIRHCLIASCAKQVLSLQ